MRHEKKCFPFPHTYAMYKISCYFSSMGDQWNPLLDMVISDLPPLTILYKSMSERFHYPPTPTDILGNNCFPKQNKLCTKILESVDTVSLSSVVWNTTANKTYMTTLSRLITWTQQSYVLETTPPPEE